MIPILDEDRCVLLQGNARDLGDVLASNSIDAIVCDPPAGIAFMGKTWDSDKGGRDAWIYWLADVMGKAFAALKPGGHALVWAIPRTSHWTATALEDAGFEIRDVVVHLFGTGFPKSLDVSKAIACARITSSDAIEKWQGFGTALKPAAEHWILCRKPLAGTVAANVQEFGTGALNIDGCRIGRAEGDRTEYGVDGDEGSPTVNVLGDRARVGYTPQPAGRWPANVTLSHLPECVTEECDGGDCGYPCDRCGSEYGGRCDDGCHGKRRCACVKCAPGCPVAMLDEQSGSAGARAPVKGTEPSAAVQSGAIYNPRARTPGAFHGDTGGASRFFYVAKPSRAERDAGCESLPKRSAGEATDREEGTDGLKSPRAGAGRTGGARNFHPTVKSIALMRWLCRLITPPGGVVLDMFTGSGSTGVAALAEGFSFVGVEQDADYIPIAAARLARALELSNTESEAA